MAVFSQGVPLLTVCLTMYFPNPGYVYVGFFACEVSANVVVLPKSQKKEDVLGARFVNETFTIESHERSLRFLYRCGILHTEYQEQKYQSWVEEGR